MNESDINYLHELYLIPEFFLAVTAVTLIIHCSLVSYSKMYSTSVLGQFSVTSLSILILFLTLVLYLHEGSLAVKHLSLEFTFSVDSLGFLSKILTITASLISIYLIQDYILEYKINSTEYELLMLYAVLGLAMLIGANDFGTIFLALELQCLSLYILSSGFKKNSIYSAESGLQGFLKFFLAGGLPTGYFLIGGNAIFAFAVLAGIRITHIATRKRRFSKITGFTSVSLDTKTNPENIGYVLQAIEGLAHSCEDNYPALAKDLREVILTLVDLAASEGVRIPDGLPLFDAYERTMVIIDPFDFWGGVRKIRYQRFIKSVVTCKRLYEQALVADCRLPCAKPTMQLMYLVLCLLKALGVLDKYLPELSQDSFKGQVLRVYLEGFDPGLLDIHSDDTGVWLKWPNYEISEGVELKVTIISKDGLDRRVYVVGAEGDGITLPAEFLI